MTKHLTEEQIKNFSNLSASDLHLVDEHLQSCTDCRQRVAEFQKTTKGIHQLNSYIAAYQPDHLIYEQLEAYLEHQLDETDKEIIDSHLSWCSQCSEDLDDLKQTQSELKQSMVVEKPSFKAQVLKLWRMPDYSFAFRTIAMAAVAAFVALVALLILQKPKDDLRAQLEQQQSENERLKKQIQQLNESKKQPAEVKNTQPLLVSLLDGNSRVEMDQKGNVYGTDAYPESYRGAVERIFQKGYVEKPGWLQQLDQPGTYVRGESTTSEPFKILYPVGVVVESDRPEFRWTSFGKNVKYQIKIFDNNYEPITSSPQIRSLSWTPPQPLKRGQIYVIQVDAFKQNGEKAYDSPSPQSKFKMLDEEKLKKLNELRMESPNSHLLLASYYSELGLIEEAEKELRILQQTNPDSLFVRKLSIR